MLFCTDECNTKTKWKKLSVSIDKDVVMKLKMLIKDRVFLIHTIQQTDNVLGEVHIILFTVS